MKSQVMSPNQIRRVGLEALAKALGQIGMVRFLQEFEVGKGDYTKEKHRWLSNMKIQDIVKGIEKKRNKE